MNESTPEGTAGRVCENPCAGCEGKAERGDGGLKTQPGWAEICLCRSWLS